MSEPSGAFALVSGDYVKTGGMDRANYALASYLLRRGRSVEFVAHRVDPGLVGLPGAHFLEVRKPLNSYLLGEPLLERAGRRVARRVSGQGGRVVVNGGNCDWGDVNWVHYVHAAWPAQGAGGLLRRARRAFSHRRSTARERRIVARARVVVANSERTRGDLIHLLGLPPERVHTVYYGTDPSLFRPATDSERAEARVRLGWNDDRPVVTFVGALGDARKGLDTLLAAWKILSSGPGWDARLVVLGAGSTRAQTLGGVVKRGASVEFLGFRRDIPQILRGSDVLVSPTRYEAYGLNVHEALCCGLPALVSRSAGVAERYPPALDGLLLPDPDDATDLAARLRRWRDDREKLGSEALSLSERLRRTTWDDMASEFLRVIGSPS